MQRNDSARPDLLVIVIRLLIFFFNDTATTEIYTLSLHDALPIYRRHCPCARAESGSPRPRDCWQDRKSTRLNSSHGYISYAVFCLKKKKTTNNLLSYVLK